MQIVHPKISQAFGAMTGSAANAGSAINMICGAPVNFAGPKADTVQFSGVFSRKPKPIDLLIKAVEANDQAGVQKLLDSGVKVNDTGKYGTPLYAAAYAGHVSMVNFLLDRGADPNRRSYNGRNLLSQLLGDQFLQKKSWLLDVTNALIPVTHIDSQDDNGWTALNVAIHNGNVVEAKALITAGADVRLIEKKQKMTPLMHSAWLGDTDLAKALIIALPREERRAYVNAKNKYNRTALNIAQGLGRKNMLSVLFPYGPLGTAGLPGGSDDPNRPDKSDGWDGLDLPEGFWDEFDPDKPDDDTPPADGGTPPAGDGEAPEA